MKHVIACMRALCSISDETVKELESLVVKCNYPKRYQLIKENIFCRYAYFTSNPQLSSSASFLRLNVLSSLN